MRLIWFNTGFLERYLPPVALPIPKGPLKGKKWMPASGLKFFSGNFEPEKAAAIQRIVRRDDIVYDVGAHVGYFSVLMSALVGPCGRVIAFEPHPRSFAQLLRHLALNGCRNVTAIQNCVGDDFRFCWFDTCGPSVAAHISANGDLAVEMVSLDSLLQLGQIPAPTFMKIDVEGAELLLLRGAEGLITRHRPVILIASHSEDLDEACCRFLSGRGYRLEAVTEFHGDRELLASPEDAIPR